MQEGPPELDGRFLNCHLAILERRQFVEKQWPCLQMSGIYEYKNVGDLLSLDLFYSDLTSCAIDVPNAYVGHELLNRKLIEVQFNDSAGISVYQTKLTLGRLGLCLYVVGKRSRSCPTMAQKLGLESGVLFVIAVNLDQH